MRIAWFTPLDEASAIAEVSVHVTAALAELHEVDIWPSDRPSRRQATKLPVRRARSVAETLDRLRGYDVAIYNVGDSSYHRSQVPIVRSHPGVVVLHDVVLHHLFLQLLVIERRDPELYVELMERHYGGPGLAAARATVDRIGTPIWHDPAELLRFPLFEEAIAGSLGVVTHSSWQRRRVEDAWAGPVCQLFLPTFDVDWEPAEDAAPLIADDDRALLVSVGSVLQNRRVDHVVEVLGRCPDLAAQVLYVVVGEASEGNPFVRALRERIAELGLKETVRLIGREPDQALRAWLHAATVFVNLRMPAMEGASASLSRELPRGKPVVVYDTGAFSDLPNGAAVKVAPGDLVGLEQALRRLLSDPSERRRVGTGGAAHARTLSVQRYAGELSAFLGERLPQGSLWSACDRAGAQLGAMRVDPRLGTFEVIRDELATMFLGTT